MNHEVSRVVLAGLGSVVVHPDIRVEHLELYRNDGVHLLEAGLHIFLRDLHRGLKTEIFSLLRGAWGIQSNPYAMEGSVEDMSF